MILFISLLLVGCLSQTYQRAELRSRMQLRVPGGGSNCAITVGREVHCMNSSRNIAGNEYIQVVDTDENLCVLDVYGKVSCAHSYGASSEIFEYISLQPTVLSTARDHPLCGVTVGGGLLCWSDAARNPQYNYFTRYQSSSHVVQASAYDDSVCILFDDGNVTCVWQDQSELSFPALGGVSWEYVYLSNQTVCLLNAANDVHCATPLAAAPLQLITSNASQLALVSDNLFVLNAAHQVVDQDSLVVADRIASLGVGLSAITTNGDLLLYVTNSTESNQFAQLQVDLTGCVCTVDRFAALTCVDCHFAARANDVLQISTYNARQYCLLTTNNTVECSWPIPAAINDNVDQLTYTQVQVFRDAFCIGDATHSVTCYNSTDESTATYSQCASFVLGTQLCCVQEDGSLTCVPVFMPSDDAQTFVGNFTQLTGGQDFVCALTADTQRASCFNLTNSTHYPVVPAALVDIAFLALASNTHTVCGLYEDGFETVCWGASGTVLAEPFAVLARPLQPLGALTTSDSGVAVLTTDLRSVYAWNLAPNNNNFTIRSFELDPSPLLAITTVDSTNGYDAPYCSFRGFQPCHSLQHALNFTKPEVLLQRANLYIQSALNYAENATYKINFLRPNMWVRGTSEDESFALRCPHSNPLCFVVRAPGFTMSHALLWGGIDTSDSRGQSLVIINSTLDGSLYSGIRVGDGSLYLQHSRVQNCGFGALQNGGAVRLTNSSATIIDCVFYNNTGNLGGAIYVKNSGQSVSLVSSSVIANNASWGGGLYATNTTLQLAYTSFALNQAADGGGAVWVVNSELSDEWGSYQSNSAMQSGGALGLQTSIYSGSNVDFYFNTLNTPSSTSNASLLQGGALYCEDGELALDSAVLEYHQLPMSTCSAQSRGGALAALGCEVTLQGVSLRNNQAARGGAMYLHEVRLLTASDCDLEANQAVDGGALFGYNEIWGRLVLTRVSFYNNMASHSGGTAVLYKLTDYNECQNVTVTGSRAWGGGTTFGDGSSLSLNLVVVDSVATGYGSLFASPPKEMVSAPIFELYSTAGAYFNETITVEVSDIYGNNVAPDPCPQSNLNIVTAALDTNSSLRNASLFGVVSGQLTFAGTASFSVLGLRAQPSNDSYLLLFSYDYHELVLGTQQVSTAIQVFIGNCLDGQALNDSMLDCYACPAGTFSQGGVPCAACPEGQEQPKEGQTRCVPTGDDADGTDGDDSTTLIAIICVVAGVALAAGVVLYIRRRKRLRREAEGSDKPWDTPLLQQQLQN